MNRLIFAWCVAAVSAVIAVVSALRVPAETAAVSPADCASELREIGQLRRRIATMQSEAGTLRAELDRMRLLLALRKGHDEREVAAGEESLTDEQRRRRLNAALEKLEKLVPLLYQNPERAVFEQMQDVLRAMIRAPLDDATPFLEKFRGTSDPMMKQLLLPQVAGRLGEGLGEFVATELEQTEDPQLRTQLVAALRAYASPAEDPLSRKLLLSSLAGEVTPEARQYAIEALAGIGAPDVEQALLGVVAGDPDSATREVAIRKLAERPRTRERLLDAIAAEPDERLRTIGECAIRLASPPGG